MNAQHPFERRAGKLDAGIHATELKHSSGWDKQCPMDRSTLQLMNSLLSRHSRRRATSRVAIPKVPRPELRWIHDGIRHRVTAWPDVRFERELTPGQWAAHEFPEPVFASTALGVTAEQWREYVEYVPAAERTLLRNFDYNRIGALHVLVRCPALLPEMLKAPALVAFLAAHLGLRGGSQPCWSEINAVHERDGIFGILQWLGLPASRQTLTILQNIADPDVPRRLLEPLRAALWEPEAIWLLSHEPALTDERIAEACDALAA
jgi:hypothetical protein